MKPLMPVLIFDVSGLELNSEEKELLQHPCAAGIILFERNYQDIHQLKALIHSIQAINPSLFITVDQEGGRVQRFRKDFTPLPPMSDWGKLFDQDKSSALLQVEQIALVTAEELRRAGISFTFAPVLDLQGASSVIGERSFHQDPQAVIQLGGAFIRGLHRGHMPAIAKHFPGHGHVAADSHQTLPIDERNTNEMINKDLVPFIQLISQFDAVMTAHILFPSVDSLPPCFSSVWLKDILRKRFGFKGVIFSDDLNMAAAQQFGSFVDCTAQALQAGCDFLLICNNRMGTIQTLEYLETHYHREWSEGRRQKLFCRDTIDCA